MGGKHTFREARPQNARNLLDESIRGKEGIVSSGQLLDELLILVQLLQVVCGHGIDAKVLRSVQIMLVTKDATSQITCQLA